ncbi:probable membrane-associated kinase regulator 4 [Carica papaya]|uniref:probable membrane-associated kinase regulator 4 n=1 Tax=Carica papaya TaxID=3649 RepID=UPI000B8C89B7|nr:probable membrane-associated kinase regulator 4 [Carica papaya]
MAVNLVSCDSADEEEYIDMEVSSYSTFFSSSPSAHPREFEFQMSSSSLEKEPTTSPADELFYKGKLLPLHLPPRLQMVEKLLQNSTSTYGEHEFSTTSTPPLTTALTTPFQSCNISPSESCQVSRELNPEEYIFEYYSTEFMGENEILPNKSRTRKLKLIKHLSLASSKLKAASTAYFKSFFRKSASSDDSKVADEGSLFKPIKDNNKYVKLPIKKAPFGQISTAVNKEKMIDDNGGCHRRSFSVSIKRQSTKTSSTTSSSSSSSSNHSNGFYPLQFLKRSSSTNSDMENSIQGAIAHCKQSHQQLMICSRKSSASHDVGFYSLSAVCDDQERVELCRG